MTDIKEFGIFLPHAAGDFVYLGIDRQTWDILAPQPLNQLRVLLFGLVTDVDDYHHAPEGFSIFKIRGNKRLPGILHGLGNLGKSIAGKIHKKELVPYPEIIQPLGLAGPGTDLDKTFPANQRINQT